MAFNPKLLQDPAEATVRPVVVGPAAAAIMQMSALAGISPQALIVDLVESAYAQGLVMKSGTIEPGTLLPGQEKGEN